MYPTLATYRMTKPQGREERLSFLPNSSWILFSSSTFSKPLIRTWRFCNEAQAESIRKVWKRISISGVAADLFNSVQVKQVVWTPRWILPGARDSAFDILRISFRSHFLLLSFACLVLSTSVFVLNLFLFPPPHSLMAIELGSGAEVWGGIHTL